jgi:DNA-binding transcriptional LysR family regulator
MQTFVRVIDTGSFSAAARSLGVSQSQVSKIVRDLEERLGARLINRTTRHLTLTERPVCPLPIARAFDALHAMA